MRKNKKKNLCERRSHIPVAQDEQISIIWMIWDVFNDIAKSPIDQKIIEALLHIFCLKFTKGAAKKRKYIFYFIVTLLTEKVNYNISFISNHTMITKIKENVHLIYREIKKNEIVPKSNYLLASIKSNKEKSIEKLRILDTFKL